MKTLTVVKIKGVKGGGATVQRQGCPWCKWCRHIKTCGDIESYEPRLGLSEDITVMNPCCERRYKDITAVKVGG